MKKEQQPAAKRIFYAEKGGFVVLSIAYNRGQAVSLIAKEMEKRNLTFSREDKVEEIDLDTEKKGRAIVLGGNS